MNKLLTILVLGLLTVSAVAFSTSLKTSATDYCPNPVYRSEAWITDFVAKLKSIAFDKDMMTFLQAHIPTDSHMFSTDQILQVFSCIHFDSS